MNERIRLSLIVIICYLLISILMAILIVISPMICIIVGSVITLYLIIKILEFYLKGGNR